MDDVLREMTASEIDVGILWSARAPGRLSVDIGGHRIPILSLSDRGFVVAAEEDRPRLRGFVDILDGENLIAHPLIVCAWEDDGMIGYEVKRDQPSSPVSPDYAP